MAEALIVDSEALNALANPNQRGTPPCVVLHCLALSEELSSVVDEVSLFAVDWSRPPRRRRADAGRSRLHPAVAAKLESLLSTRQRPSIAAVQKGLGAFCSGHALPRPSRAAVYAAIERLAPPSYDAAKLPFAVRASLYNLDEHARIPGEQLVFHAFNYGDVAAVSFASGLPWVCLRAAHRLRGWRPKSRSLLESVLARRGIRVASQPASGSRSSARRGGGKS